VKLERWDTYRDEEITPHWLLRAPHDGTTFAYKNRTGGTAPAFAGDAQPVAVGNITRSTCSVSFPQATDDEVVHHYKVEILNDNFSLYPEEVWVGYDASGYPGPEYAELRVWGDALTAEQAAALGQPN
jgi:hypothetical protein